MKKYLGVKIISAEPQIKFGLPADKDTVDELGSAPVEVDGYKVVYEDGYESWSPADVFEKAYRPIDGLTFGLALEAMKKGRIVSRKGWNNPNITCKIQFPDENSFMTMPYVFMMKNEDRFPLDLSCESILAEDWYVVE